MKAILTRWIKVIITELAIENTVRNAIKCFSEIKKDAYVSSLPLWSIFYYETQIAFK